MHLHRLPIRQIYKSIHFGLLSYWFPMVAKTKDENFHLVWKCEYILLCYTIFGRTEVYFRIDWNIFPWELKKKTINNKPEFNSDWIKEALCRWNVNIKKSNCFWLLIVIEWCYRKCNDQISFHIRHSNYTLIKGKQANHIIRLIVFFCVLFQIILPRNNYKKHINWMIEIVWIGIFGFSW